MCCEKSPWIQSFFDPTIQAHFGAAGRKADLRLPKCRIHELEEYPLAVLQRFLLWQEPQGVLHCMACI
jgi:hypothetical protein